MDELLKNLSVNDIEKLKLLFSIIPGYATTTEKTLCKEEITLQVFSSEYKNLIKQTRSASYLRSVKLTLDHFESFFDSHKSINAIRLKDVEDFLTHLQQNVRKGYVVYFRNLKAAFNKAKEWGYVSENFFTKVKLPKRQKLAPAFITGHELQGISDKIIRPIVKDVVEFAFFSGMRLHEIVNLKWNNVDLLSRIITIGDEEFITKGRTQRFIPMTDEIFEMLERRKNQEASSKNNLIHLVSSKELPIGSTRDFVFCKKSGEKFSGNYFSRIFKRTCKAAGLNNNIHFHTLRHSFASNLVQKGVPLYTIKELLGHSSVSTTEIYSHLNMDSLREAIEKFDASTSLGTGSRITENEVKEKSITGHTPSFPLSRRESNDVKIFRIDAGVKK